MPLPVQADRYSTDAMTGAVAPTARRSAAAPAELDRRSGSPLRFWLGVVVAGVVSLPFCWLLSFAALLPFYLGLFFFALFGLLIGALVYRVAAPPGKANRLLPGRPYGAATVLTGTTILVLGVWCASLVKEGRDLPRDMAEKALSRTPDLGGRTADEFREVVASEVRTFLRRHHPPGGALGYIRWALAGGRFQKGDLPSVGTVLSLSQARYIFAIRLVLSVGLLAFGVASQTWPLRMPDDGSRPGGVSTQEA